MFLCTLRIFFFFGKSMVNGCIKNIVDAMSLKDRKLSVLVLYGANGCRSLTSN